MSVKLSIQDHGGNLSMCCTFREQPDRENLIKGSDDNLPRLLVLTSTYPRWIGDPEPAFVHELARRLTGHFRVKVLCPHARGALPVETMDGVEVQRYRYAPGALESLVNDGGIVVNLRQNPLKWLLVPLFFAGQALASWRALRQFKPNVIHAHWLIPQGLVVALLSLISGRVPPFLVTSHGADLHALKSWPLQALKRFVARRAAALTVVSKGMLEELRNQGIKCQNVAVEPMGVDLQSKFVPDDTVERSRAEILFVGRLVEKKGLRYLIEAMPSIIKHHPAARLTVAGFGPEEGFLKKHAKELGVADRVHFLGAVSQEKLPSLYRRAAVFVAPFVEAKGGDQEGLGLVTVEAIGCECPVVVSDLPAIADVIPDKERRVEPANPIRLAEAIAWVLSDIAGSDGKQIGKFRSEIVERMDWSRRAVKYREILHTCVKRAAHG